MHILVVHRQPPIHAAACQLAASLRPPARVTSTDDVANARRAIAAGAGVDLVLVEVSAALPAFLEFVAALHAMRPALPIVALASPGDRGAAARALAAGACGVVPASANVPTLATAARLLPAPVRAPVSRCPETVAVPAPAGGRAGAECWSYRTGELDRVAPLTQRQSEVLALIAQGKPNKLICRELQLSEGTVKVHVSAVLRALNVNNRTQAALAAGRLGITTPSSRPELHEKNAPDGSGALREGLRARLRGV